MNTTVEYKRPGRNRHGEYRSVTFINRNNVIGHIKISLVWFIGLGWYYSIELEGWQFEGKKIGKIILEYSKNKDIWKHGKELPLCAIAAECEANEMLKQHGVVGLEFSPYVLPRK